MSENHAIVPYSDIEKMGTAVAQSGLFGVRTPVQAIALMLVAQAEGRSPASAAIDYDIIQGRPSLKAVRKLARFQQKGGIIKWLERTDTRVSAEFSHPASCPTPLAITWDIDRAKKAGLTGKDTWVKFPQQMLSARVISEGVNAVYPDAGSMYVPEEVVDFTDFQVIDSTQAAPQTLPDVQKPAAIPVSASTGSVGAGTKPEKQPPAIAEGILSKVTEATTKTGKQRWGLTIDNITYGTFDKEIGKSATEIEGHRVQLAWEFDSTKKWKNVVDLKIIPDGPQPTDQAPGQGTDQPPLPF